MYDAVFFLKRNVGENKLAIEYNTIEMVMKINNNSYLSKKKKNAFMKDNREDKTKK